MFCFSRGVLRLCTYISLTLLYLVFVPVQNTTCIQESSNVSHSWQSCAVAGDLPHVIPRVFSGDTMNLTVSLGTSQQRLHPTLRNQDPVIGIVQLQQSPDGSLFVIGDTRQKMQMGLAAFNNMALQPVTPPVSNREYEFRYAQCTMCSVLSERCVTVPALQSVHQLTELSALQFEVMAVSCVWLLKHADASLQGR